LKIKGVGDFIRLHLRIQPGLGLHPECGTIQHPQA
jgi:hypothetical protein